MAILPAGSFNTSKRVYTALKVGDVVEGGVEKVTRGLWSGNVGTLTSFHTSSAQSDTQKQYYYEVFDGISTGVTSESQFSVTYGHNQGSGSLGQNEDSPSNAIYAQYAQILLPDRLKDRLDPGNFELHLAKLTGAGAPAVHGDNFVVSLIDNSGDTQQAATQIGRVYSLVSGSILDGVHPVADNVKEYGSVYPEQGVIILNADKLDLSQLDFGTNVASNTNGDNAFRLFTAISGAAAINANHGFAARNEEKVQSTFYFIRAKNGEYNFSNNPSFTTGSNGAFKQKTFANNPKSYITTVGLYNSTQELLAVAKLSKPILKSFSNEVLVKVKLDF